jgi:hypothetical protein
MTLRLFAASTAVLFALTACGGGGDSESSESAGSSSGKESSEAKPTSTMTPKPTAKPTTMEEVGEQLGVDLVQKAVLVEATKKVKQYPDDEAGQAALTAAAGRGCAAIKASSGDGAGPRAAIRSWAKSEALNNKDGKVVLLAALVSVCPEAEKLLGQR